MEIKETAIQPDVALTTGNRPTLSQRNTESDWEGTYNMVRAWTA